MPFIGGGHLWLMVILLAIVLIIWGPGKLPEMGAGIGRAIREFRHATSEVKEQVSLSPSPVKTAAPADNDAARTDQSVSPLS